MSEGLKPVSKFTSNSSTTTPMTAMVSSSTTTIPVSSSSLHNKSSVTSNQENFDQLDNMETNQCRLCRADFDSNEELEEHNCVEKHDNMVRMTGFLHVCLECGESFTTRSILNHH